MMAWRITVSAPMAMVMMFAIQVGAQPYGKLNRGQPGDEPVQAYLARQAGRLHEQYLAGVATREQWEARRERYQREYYFMLGLWPVPEKTPLHATVTGTLEGDGYRVDMIHFQSRPGLYVTGNLYRPAGPNRGVRLPAVLYVCGHSSRGRNGNKTAYQSHGIWFARHGYVCLALDSLQLGEIASVHHGTYRENRWWWLSRGYTPAGVECWNGIRGIDYLISRDDVDAQRIAVTGISGGGAATFWIAAADARVRVAVPVSGMADLPSYVSNRVINGHCDCMFLHNAYRWPWTRIAAQIAPRPLLFVNSDQDDIFPMDANRRITNRLEQIYSLHGAGDRVDSVVSLGGHAYRKDIRQAAFRFINTHLKNDPRPVADSEVDLVSGSKADQHPIAPQRLRVFPQDSDIPADARNATIDQSFVRIAAPGAPRPDTFATWRGQLIEKLKEVTFGSFPQRIEPARTVPGPARPGDAAVTTETIASGDGFALPLVRRGQETEKASRIVLWVATENERPIEQLAKDVSKRRDDVLFVCQPRGVGPTRWTIKNPPNYVERSHVLLGCTVATGQVRDIIAAARLLRARHDKRIPICVAGHGRGAIVAAYAALLAPEIDEVRLEQPPATHMDPNAPVLLNALRVCDIPQVLMMLAPRPLTIVNGPAALCAQVRAGYQAAGAEARLKLIPASNRR